MATWAKDAMYGLLLTQGAYIRENPVNKYGRDANAWFNYMNKNKEFSAWLLSLYAPWCTENFVHKGPRKHNSAYTWTTRSFPFLLAMYKEMYIDGKRIIPQYVFTNMSPSMFPSRDIRDGYCYRSHRPIGLGLFSLADPNLISSNLSRKLNLQLDCRVSREASHT